MFTGRNVYVIIHHLELIGTKLLYLHCGGVAPVSQVLKCALNICFLVEWIGHGGLQDW
jgi:hypothetical protein